MIYRRILYLGQFFAAVMLPLWILIARGLFDDSAAWEFLVYLLICGLLALVMFLVATLTVARRSSRTARVVSVPDAVLLTVWYVALLAYSIWPWPVFAVPALVLTVGAAWLAAWQLFTETRRRIRGMVAEFEQAARPPMSPGHGRQSPRVIVINPSEDDQRG